MFIKRFVVKTMPQAMDLIRQELGADAVILSSRKMRSPGVSGWFGQKVYEVVAAAEPKKKDSGVKFERPMLRSAAPTSQTAGNWPAVGSSMRSSNCNAELAASAVVTRQFGESARDAGASVSTDHPPQRAVEMELQEIRSLLSTLVLDGGAHSNMRNNELARLTDLWSQTSLSRKLVERFLTQHVASMRVGEGDLSLERLAENFVRKVMAGAGPCRVITPADRVVALMGPTGVGKTTTIAKLAALARVRDGRNVGLLTLDTFRVGAVEQLRTYADILNIPFAVAHSAVEVEEQLETLHDCDLILVDTTGRSFLDRAQVAELEELLSHLPIDLKYLVLSLTLRTAEAGEVARSLSGIGYDALLFTKKDEALLPSLALTMADELGKPLSYIATGQHVPDDLRVADSDWLSPLFSGGEYLARSG